ncbi:DUF5615 family PIN-like protein [Microcoleus sp.]|uniref:DUF5615 family PIN-like protein n=1 Tax=Microcoleus sp. TaxID=44472 RepID=UPI00403E9516
MIVKYLLDENMAPEYRVQLLYHQSDIIVLVVGDEGVPPKGTKDPEILCWCEENNFILITNNRRSMPVHLSDHIAQGRHVPEILTIRLNVDIGKVIEGLIEIAGASFENEYQDRIEFIPLS